MDECDGFAEESLSLREKLRNHYYRYRTEYICAASLIGFALITHSVMRRNFITQPINGGISAVADGGISVVGKKVVMDNVSYISQNRKGPPSWVVRNLETGAVFTSQKAAASELEIPASELSKHLNGLMENVRGLHFERVCMAA